MLLISHCILLTVMCFPAEGKKLVVCVAFGLPPLFFFFIRYLCAKSLQSFQQLPPTQNPQDFPSLIQNCNQVRSPGGKQPGCSVSVCDVLWMATNCCAACQHVKPGALEREKWKINWCRLPERSRDCNTWERRWGTFQQMHWHVTLNYSITQKSSNMFLLDCFFFLRTSQIIQFLLSTLKVR